MNIQKWRDSLLSFVDSLKQTLYPELKLKQTAWESAWDDQVRNTNLRITRIAAVCIGGFWFAQYFILDVPLHLQPPNFWFGIRLGLFLWSMLCFALTFVPAIGKSKWLQALSIAHLWAYCFVEAELMTASPLVSHIYPALFIFISVLLINANLFWSLAFTVITLATQWPAFTEACAQKMPEVYNVLCLLFAAVYLNRVRRRHEISSFIDVRELGKAREELLTRELELTGAVQNFILPRQNLVESAHFKLAAKFIPATQSGGDWWWFRQDADKLRLILGDVTGHGAGPAMITVSASSFATAHYRANESMGELIAKIEKNYVDYFESSRYWMAFTAAEFDFKTMRMKIWFGGGPPLFLIEADGKVDALSMPGVPLGSRPFALHEEEFVLQPGQRLIFSSDGIFEERMEANGKARNERQIRNLITESRSLNAEAANDFVVTATKTARGRFDQADDYTLVTVDIKGASVRTSVA